jgi:hypothetical protein
MHFVSFTFISISFGEWRLLVSWCAGGKYGILCNNEDHGRSSRSGAEDWGWSHTSGTRGRAIERSGGAMCGLHRVQGDEVHGFLS